MSGIAIALVTATGAVLVAIIGYLGIKMQATASRHANNAHATAAEEASSIEALKVMATELLEPYRLEVKNLRADIGAERQARAEEHREMQLRMTAQDERIDLLNHQLKHWKRLAKVMARWAVRLRDQVVALGGQVSASPDELALIQSLDDEDL